MSKKDENKRNALNKKLSNLKRDKVSQHTHIHNAASSCVINKLSTTFNTKELDLLNKVLTADLICDIVCGQM